MGRSAVAALRRRKYGNTPTEVDGIRFDSKKEAGYYAMLKIRERAGEVTQVELQVPFPLIVGAGEVIGIYKSDFCFWDIREDRFRCIDCKGFDTPLSKHKRKHVRAQYGVEVELA